MALVLGDRSCSTTELSIEPSATSLPFRVNALIRVLVSLLSPVKKLYVYNRVILLTKNKPVNKIKIKVWALPDESSLPVHTGP